MQRKQFSATAAKYKALQELMVAIQTGTIDDACNALALLRSSPLFTGKGWQAIFAKLSVALTTGTEQFSIFKMDGNSKLPFVAFSSAPGVTCPGAGNCLTYCYSYAAWRFPAAVCRMAQNAFFMRHHRDVIWSSFASICDKRPEGFDFRLYVDGDFSSLSDVAFWFNLLSMYPAVRAYGYSKSFEQILMYADTGCVMPSNYQLNISSGHNASEYIVAQVKALPIARGEFVAVNIGRKVKSSDHGTVATNKALREAYGKKAFTCPGKCGSCTGKGHACGMPSLKGLPIIIAVH